MAEDKRDRGEILGPGSVGAWTEEELERLPKVEPHPENATREDDDPEALRKGTARANVREGAAEPLSEEAAHVVPDGNRRGITPGNEGYRRGEVEEERGTV